MTNRKNKLAENLRQYVFEMLDAEAGFSAMDAGHVAHCIEMAFNAVYDASPSRWSIGDTYQTSGKNPQTATVSNVVRSYDLNGKQTLRYESEREFLGQTITDRDVTDTTIARGRICHECGVVARKGCDCK